jgi:hypothetical protein
MSAYDYLLLNGVIVPDTSEILQEVQQEYKDSFNDQNLAVTPDTPQGVLITAETFSRSGQVRNNAAIANQINPNQAGGVFLDAIWALTGGARIPSTSTVVSVNLTGQPNALIPQSVILQSTNGDYFQIAGSVNLDSTGNATANFIATVPGPIAATVGSINSIYVGVLGLETVINTTAGVIGSLTESDDASRKRRRNTLAGQGSGSLEAIASGLYNTQNVLSLQGIENQTDVIQIKENVIMKKNSIYFCVDGGTDLDVAKTIRTKKGGGCGYTNGASSNPVTVNIEYLNVLYPVSFDRPDFLQVLVRVTARDNGIPIDISAAIKKAVIDWANGLVVDNVGLTVGMNVSSFDIAGAIKIENPGIDVTLVETTFASLINYSSLEIPIEVWQKAVIQNESSVVVILI